MITSRSISLSRIVSGSWKNLIYISVTAGIAFFVDKYLLASLVDTSTLLPSILGTALAFFIGFNNNQAYDRWWEARKIWGMLVNESRTWARQWLCYADVTSEIKENDLQKLRDTAINRQIGFIYALKESLRGTAMNQYHTYLDQTEINMVEKETNRPNAILGFHGRDLDFAFRSGLIDGFRFQEMNRTLTSLCNEMGKSERIKNTVFPTPYNYYTRIFIFVFVIFEVWGTAGDIGMWSIFTGTLIGYIFLTTQAIGLALLNPFEGTPSGIPLDQISRTIEINLLEMEGAMNIPKPIDQQSREYVT